MKYGVSFAILLYLMAFSFIPACSQTAEDRELPGIDLSSVKQERLPYTLSIFRKFAQTESMNVYPVNLDDGGDELLKLFSLSIAGSMQRHLVYEDVRYGSVMFQKNFPGSSLICISEHVFDVDGDGMKEFFISEANNGRVNLHAINRSGQIVHTVECAEAPDTCTDIWECVVVVEDEMDVNGDRHPDLILSVDTGYGFQPRGIYAYDIYNRRFLWEYKTGFAPRTVKLLDINGDGKREILFGSAAPGNGGGARINNTDDTHSYLTVLDSAGTCLTSQIVGGEFSSVDLSIHDLNGNGEKEIIVLYEDHSDKSRPDYFAVWNPVFRHLGPKIEIAKKIIRELSFLDVNRDGKDDIIIGWDDGTIECRDYNLDLIQYRRFENLSPVDSKVSDLNNDGNKEIIISGVFKGCRTIIVLNRKLELLAYLPGYTIAHTHCIVNQEFGENRLCIAKSSKDVFLLALRKQIYLFPAVSWYCVFLGVIIGLIAAVSFFAVLYMKKSGKTVNKALDKAFDLHGVGLLTLDSNGIITGINRTMEKTAHKNREFMLHQTYADALGATPLREIITLIESSYIEKKVFIEKELTVLFNELPVTLLVTITHLLHDNRTFEGRLVSVRDITDIVESKRVVAWAGMAQKLAHEIKTPLSTLMLSAQHIKMEQDRDPGVIEKSEKYIGYIIDQVNRLRNMTDDFLKFANIEKPQIETVSINDLITEMLHELKLKIGSGIEIETVFAQNLPDLHVDKEQIMIAMKNIVNNSITAMEEQGVLTVTTRLVQKLPGNTSVHSLNGIQMLFSDTGRGICREDLPRLFQPFFSKSSGGTGMGLVIVKKIIEDHRGTIHVESKQGIGTTVFVTIPCNNNHSQGKYQTGK